MKHKILWSLIGSMIAASLVLVSCAGGGGNGGNGGNEGDGGDGEGGPPRPWSVRYGFPLGLVGAAGFNPVTTIPGIVFMQTAETLCYLDPVTHKPAPALATSWEVAPDHSYIDYTIRQGIPFSNGDMMTAEDVKFSYDRMFNVTLGNGLALLYIEYIDRV